MIKFIFCKRVEVESVLPEEDLKDEKSGCRENGEVFNPTRNSITLLPTYCKLIKLHMERFKIYYAGILY